MIPIPCIPNRSALVLDLLVEHQVHVGLLTRDKAVTKVLVGLYSHYGNDCREVSAADLLLDDVEVKRIGGTHVRVTER
jgi:hypothetical protein